MVTREQVLPAAVAELRRTLRRAVDVGEEHGREHAVRRRPPPHPHEELLDLVQDLVLVPDERQVIVARELCELRAFDPLGQVAGALDRQCPVTGPVDDEGRCAHGGEHVTRIDRPVHLSQGVRRSRARAHTQIAGPPRSETLVVCEARGAHPEPHRLAPALECPRQTPRSPRASCRRDSPRPGAGGHSLRSRRAPASAAGRSRQRAGTWCRPPRCPMRAARSDPTASMTARTSSMRCSSVGSSSIPTRSERPVSRLSKRIRRERRQGARGSARGKAPPADVEVGNPPQYIDEVERSIADDLIRDIDVA